MTAEPPASSLENTLAAIHSEAEECGLGTEIPASEANDLRWFFRTHGQPEDSGWGAQFSKAGLYAIQARPCTRCGGNLDKLTGGCGWMPSSPNRRKPTEHEVALLKWSGSKSKTLPPRSDVPCTSCDGKGWIEGRRKRHWRNIRMFYVSSRYVNGSRGPLKWHGPFTHAIAEQCFEDLSCEYDDVSMAKGRAASDGFDALPSGSSIKGSGKEAGDVATHRLAVISGRIDQMTRRWPLAVDVFDSWYGEDGGTLVALWPLTGPGKTLLRRNKNELPPSQFFANERNDAQDKQDNQRLAMFNEADSQSRTLLSAARTLWNIVSDSDLSHVDVTGGEAELAAQA